QLAAWAAEHGLLGLLVHRAERVVLEPTWQPYRQLLPLEPNDRGRPAESGAPAFGVLSEPGRDDSLRPSLSIFGRTSLGWSASASRSDFGNQTPALTGQPHRKGEPVAPEDVPDGWPRPGVLLRDLAYASLVDEPLDGTWARYFPDIPRAMRQAHAYPMPTTE